ncbi:MAG TPA: acetylglutamate kinase [Dehalococcoidia bacterium]|jgi:acetylglutamate kinase
MKDTIVIKIGGSTLGSHDTTLQDVADLHRRGAAPIVVHGGGPLISDWLKLTGIPTRFEHGLRVTDSASLDVVVAVLAGLVNKQLVASLEALGVRAIGLTGADGGLLRCRIADPALGFVGEVEQVEAGVVSNIIEGGAVPVIAPIGLLYEDGQTTGQLLNVNADTAAGAIATALAASWLVFMTDVPGVKADGRVLEALNSKESLRLIESGVIEGGMIPKVRACLQAGEAGARGVIVDGRGEHALLSLLDGAVAGTVVG